MSTLCTDIATNSHNEMRSSGNDVHEREKGRKGVKSKPWGEGEAVGRAAVLLLQFKIKKIKKSTRKNNTLFK